MDTLEQKIRDGAQQVHDENATSDQFAVANTSFHTHNGADSQQINFSNIVGRFEFLNETLPGTTAATAGNYGVIFIAPYRCTFMGATEVHSVLGTSGSAVTLQIERLVGTTATGSGINLLGSSGFNLKGTINTVQTATLAVVPKRTFTLNKGDRLGLSLTGTPTSVSQLVIIVQLSY